MSTNGRTEYRIDPLPRPRAKRVKNAAPRTQRAAMPDSSTRQPVRQPVSSPARDPRAVRVLVVDDDTSVGDLLCRRLEFDGMRCEERTNAEDGLAAYIRAHCDDDPFDAVLIDIGLGTTRGQDLLTMLRSADARTAIASPRRST